MEGRGGDDRGGGRGEASRLDPHLLVQLFDQLVQAVGGVSVETVGGWGGGEQQHRLVISTQRPTHSQT